MFFNTKNTAVILIVCAVCSFAQSRPFPQAGKNGFIGTVIKPSNRTQDQLNQDVTKIYDSYKSRFHTQSGNKHYIKATGNGEPEDYPSGCYKKELTISEAHGYGMIIFALMAGYDKDAKTIFDGMNELRKAQKATGNSNLMSWVVCNINANGQVGGSATDGDLDNAYALLLAYKQWGDSKYLNDATTLINAIKSSEMHGSPYYRTNLGDWNKSGNATRSSDWMPGHFRAFREATGDAFWSQAADTVYNLLAQCSNPTTGLIPDFAKGQPAKADPTAGGTGEDDADKYSYNACRDPWRLALAYAHHGDAKAKSQIDKISAWLRGSSGAKGEPNNIKAGYYLNGNVLNEWSEIIFTAPFASGMIADKANQSFLDKTYGTIRTASSSNNEYATALQLLNVLLISGNWWAPYSSGSTPIVFEKLNQVKNAGVTVSKSGINLNIPDEKVVQVKISDTKGRLLLNKDITLNSGVASLNFPSSMTKSQLLILNVKGKNGLNVSQKILP